MALSTSVRDNLLQDRYHQDSTALCRVLEEAPYITECSDNKTASLKRPRALALRFPYMRYNRAGMVSWLVFDLDHNNPWIWEGAGLPAPNLIVRDRQSNNSQLWYAIEPVCTTSAARSKPINWMKALYEDYRERLSADQDYKRGNMAKTPGHPWWDTTELHAKVYSLGELAEHINPIGNESAPRKRKPVDLTAAAHSRHCMLFDLVRHYAYSIVDHAREASTFQRFTTQVEAYAHNSNTFARMGNKDGDLPLSSVRATVKSIARWTWDNYTGCSRCHRGVMRLDDSLPVPARQRLSAARTHDVRRKATESKIRAMCQNLRINGREVTIAALARVTQLTRQTIAKYKHIIAEAASTVLNLPPKRSGDVKYGAHQVTGRWGLPLSSGVQGGAVSANESDQARFDAEKPPFDAEIDASVAENSTFDADSGDGSGDPPPF